MRDDEGIRYMKELLADGECTAEQLHKWVDEAQQMRDAALSYLRHEKGVWRVELNRVFDQVPRVNYVETVATDTEEDVRRWQMEAIDAFNSQRRTAGIAYHPVVIKSIRRATEDDLEEMLFLD